MNVKLVLGCATIVVAACSVEPDTELEDVDEASQAVHHVNGKKLFERETFDGNGRTCATCHSKKTGTISPADVQERFEDDPNDPLFRSLDSDDGVGNSYTRLLEEATILVTLPLPEGWALADEPGATSVTLERGIPTTLNVPSLDDIFMIDGRNDTLEEQALGAINSHYEPGRQPTEAELEAIADHQQTNRFFSNNKLKHWANGGPAPQLPAGHTASEIRGRLWFVPSAAGICSHCHSGPMLNETNEFIAAPVPPGTRFFTAFVSELNKGGNQVRTFEVTAQDGTVTTIASPDPGRALITGNPADANAFRIPTIWGAKKTAPYFHDNSAATLEELVQHYSDYFQIVGLPALSAQEQADIVAYTKLL